MLKGGVACTGPGGGVTITDAAHVITCTSACAGIQPGAFGVTTLIVFVDTTSTNDAYSEPKAVLNTTVAGAVKLSP
jgi:hypothetical protein